MQMKKKKILVLAAVLAVLLLTAGCGETGQGKQEDLKGNMVLSFINIGKGDSIFDPRNRTADTICGIQEKRKIIRWWNGSWT